MISKTDNLESSNDNAREVTADGIVHFDATARRRSEMKSQSMSQSISQSQSIVQNAAPKVEVKLSSQVQRTAVPAVVESVYSQSSSAVDGTHVRVNGAISSSPSFDISSWKNRVQSGPTTNVQTTPATISELPETSVASPTTGSWEDYKKFLVGFVVEQTGYPEDVVEIDADLEADLGIDSIKIAQMIGELYEHFSVDWKAIKVQSMDEFKTLRNIIDVLVETSKGEATTGAKESLVTSSEAVQVDNSPKSVVNPLSVNDTQRIRDEMTTFLVQFVVEQTGYPEDVVELDADLEADLGIDSIKIAQMMGELNEFFGLNVAALTKRSADDFKTLRAIVDTVVEAGVSKIAGDQSSANEDARQISNSMVSHSASHGSSSRESTATSVMEPPASISHQSTSQPAKSPEAIKKFLVEFVVEQTGYPEDVVEIDADLEADLGIDSIKIAQMFGELNEYFQIDIRRFTGRTMEDFKTLRNIIDFISENAS